MENEIARLTKIKDRQFLSNPEGVLSLFFEMANDPLLRDTYTLGKIYTKNDVRPKPKDLASVVDKTVDILYACFQWTTSKKLPLKSIVYYTKADDVKQDHFITCLTSLFDKTFSQVCGDRVIQIGSTFQVMGQKDCYFKHIIVLDTCDPITNDDMILAENAGIYLPSTDLAKELIGLGLASNVKDVKSLTVEIDTVWTKEQRQEACTRVANARADKQRQTDVANVVVESYKTEEEVLLAWQRLIVKEDPDIVIGYNIFGFDFKFLYERAEQLGIRDEFCQLSRLKNHVSPLVEFKLSSSAYGNNVMEMIEMLGRTCIDLYKVMQREYQLDSYKLDSVCSKFLYKEKVDVSPQEIFIAQRGNASDRQKVAVYCLVDCILCNRLITKLDILNGKMCMANVCKVPLTFIFLKGQSIKVTSLLAYECAQNGYVIPHNEKSDDNDDDKYEGAIVLNPVRGIHLIPTVCLDFSSLYPSSICSENVSHDTLVTIGGKYDNMEGCVYSDITFDEFKMLPNPLKPRAKKLIKTKVGNTTCRYVQNSGTNAILGLIPKTLMHLLRQREIAKGKMENETDYFKKALWNATQLAYKTTANSIYGSLGASTGAFYNALLAKSTTSIGRSMIIFTRDYILSEYKNRDIVLSEQDTNDDKGNPTKYSGMKIHVNNSFCLYGDTDSVFLQFIFNKNGENGENFSELDIIFISMSIGKIAAREVTSKLKSPQKLLFEKAMTPFLLFRKKGYVAHYYTQMNVDSYYLKSMGIVLKRRDNAPIVKHIYGGVIKTIMKEHDIDKAHEFLITECKKLLKGEFPIEMFITSKTLKGFYKKPNSIAHNVLANRVSARTGCKIQSNDRIAYVYIIPPKGTKKDANGKILQGDRIEIPEYTIKNNIPIDYMHYLTNQIQIPVSQVFEFTEKYKNISRTFTRLIEEVRNEKRGIKSFDDVFIPSTIKYKTLKDLQLLDESEPAEWENSEQSNELEDDLRQIALDFADDEHEDDMEYESIFD